MMTNADPVAETEMRGGAVVGVAGAATHNRGVVDVMTAARKQKIGMSKGGGGCDCDCDCRGAVAAHPDRGETGGVVQDHGVQGGRDVEELSPCGALLGQHQHPHRQHQQRRGRGLQRGGHGHHEHEEKKEQEKQASFSSRASLSSYLELGVTLASQPWETIGILDVDEGCDMLGDSEDLVGNSSGNNDVVDDTPTPTFDELVGRVSAVLEHRLTEVVLDRQRSARRGSRRPSLGSFGGSSRSNTSTTRLLGGTTTLEDEQNSTKNLDDVLDEYEHETSSMHYSPQPLVALPILLPLPCRVELREFVRRIGSLYRDCKYHRFEHAVHVTVSANKLIHLMEEGSGSSGGPIDNDDDRHHPHSGGEQNRERDQDRDPVGEGSDGTDTTGTCGREFVAAKNHGHDGCRHRQQHVGEVQVPSSPASMPGRMEGGSCTSSAATASTAPLSPSESSLLDNMESPLLDCQDSSRQDMLQHDKKCEARGCRFQRTEGTGTKSGSGPSGGTDATVDESQNSKKDMPRKDREESGGNSGGGRCHQSRRSSLPPSAAEAIDPLSKFCLVFSALVHDVDHQGVPNAQLTRERDELAVLYDDTSVAEQHSIKVAFSTLMSPDFAEFRRTLLPTSADQFAFRMRVIDLVMCTDIASPERMQHARAKWSEAFERPMASEESSSPPDSSNLRVSTVTASRPKLVHMRRNSNPLFSSSSALRMGGIRRSRSRRNRTSLPGGSADLLSTSLDASHHFHNRRGSGSGSRTTVDDRSRKNPEDLCSDGDDRRGRGEDGAGVTAAASDHEDDDEEEAMRMELQHLRASVVLETMMNAADVAHTLQSFDNFLKWNRRLYEELFVAYVSGRTEHGRGVGFGSSSDGDDDDDDDDNPARDWYKNQLVFYDIYILPLARKLMQCGAFGDDAEAENSNEDQGGDNEHDQEGRKNGEGLGRGTSRKARRRRTGYGRRLVDNALEVRRRWEEEGESITADMIDSVRKRHREEAATRAESALLSSSALYERSKEAQAMQAQAQAQAQAQPQQHPQTSSSSQTRNDDLVTNKEQLQHLPRQQSDHVQYRRSRLAESRTFMSTPTGLGCNPGRGHGDEQAFFIPDDDDVEVDVDGSSPTPPVERGTRGRHGRAHRRSSSLGTSGSFDSVIDSVTDMVSASVVGSGGGGGGYQGGGGGVDISVTSTSTRNAIPSSSHHGRDGGGPAPIVLPASSSLCRRRSMSADNLARMAAIAAASEIDNDHPFGAGGVWGAASGDSASAEGRTYRRICGNYRGDGDGERIKYLPHRARRYLPKILREMYACQPAVTTAVTAAAITTNADARKHTHHPLLVSEGARAALELRLRLRRPKALPAHRDLRGTVLILDLSGFTALGERLKHELGDSEGAAEFAHRVNAILSTMVERVYEFGGDVLMFAGDALICLFEEMKKAAVPAMEENGAEDAVGCGGRGVSAEEATLSRVRECCLRVLGEVAWNNEASSGSRACDDFTLHGGACHGLVRCLFLGQPSSAPGDCAFIVSGLPLLRAGKLLNRAGEGEILIDGFEEPITEEAGKKCFFQPQCSNNAEGGGGIAGTSVHGSECENGGNIQLSISQESAMTASVTASAPSSQAADIAGYNIHPFARAYLGTLAARRSDQAEGNAMSMLLNELRPVAIVFVGLHDLNNIARDTKLLHLMNSTFVSLSRITYGCNGAVRDMLCDDKGCVFISVFGAHSHEVNPCFDATVCAMRMQEALDELRMRQFSLGVSFGDCFCGEVGPSIRADYVVMGTEVNMAARLMGKAPNRGILASKRVYTNAKKFIQFSQSEHLKVKGKDGFFHAYIPQARVVRGNNLLDDGTHQQPFILLPSRELEMMKMLNALHEADDGQPKVLTMCGGPFLGKSRMIRSLSDKATAANFTVLKSFRTSLDSFTSYYPFRQIVLMALQRCASALLGVQTEHEVSAMGNLIENKVLNKSDRVILGSILPTVADAQLLSLLRGQNPKALTKNIVDALMKLIVPLQPAMLVFEGDGEIDPSSWSLISEMMQRATTECPRLLLVIISRNALTMPSSVSHLQRDAEHAKLAPLDKYETEIYLEVLLGIHDKGIGVDQKLLDAVHDRANGCPSFIEFIVSWALGKSMIEYIDNKNVMSLNLPVAPSEDVTTAIPRELSSIVLASFNDLPPILWDVLKIASCIGYSFDANLYEALDGDLDFMPKIEELATSYDVFERSDGCRYKWKHQAVYEAVKSLLINNQRVQIHSMIAEVFERQNMDEQYSDMVKGDMHRLLARHCSLADKWDGAFRQYMEAGKRAEETCNFPEAAKMYEEALSCQEKMTPKPLLRSRLLPTVRLGNCLRELARYNDAESVLKECLCDAENAMNESDADEEMYVHALTALAALNQAQSKYNEARHLYEKALPIARSMQESRSSLWLAVHIAGYAETLRKSGDLASAETLHWEALHIRSFAANERGCTALEMAVSYTQLGCTLFGRGKYEEAYNQHRSALRSRFELLDFSHGLVSESLNYCAEALCALGRGGDGIPLAMHAVIIRKVVFGVSHPAYAHALSVLASCYHAIGRSCDARDCLEECLAICEGAFPKNHANIIPNLMNYGKVLRSTGELEKARDVYERAIVIHQTNFKEGQRAVELETCQSQVHELSIEIARSAYDEDAETLSDRDGGVRHMYVPIPTVDVESGRTPIIVLTDIGRDVDDEYALVLLAALKSMDLLDPIAVVATLSPERERAHLARGVLDIMGLPNVPVGIGSAGGAKLASALDVYGAEYSRSCSCIIENGVDLMARALAASPDKSVQLLVIASLTDAASLVRDHDELFVSKVKEVIVMGGLNKLDRAERVAPDTAYNNNCDTAAAAFVYERCQELGVPTLTLSRFAAYGCPVPTAVLDNLKKTEHMVANNIRDVSLSSINQLWKKVNLPPSDTRREKLPPRCDRRWFCHTFMGKDDIDLDESASIWSHVRKLNMYDPLALLCCVPAYREVHFQLETKTVKQVPHSIIGVSEVDTGIIDAESLCGELFSLFRLSFLNSLQNICTRRVAKQRTSMDF